MLPFYTAVKTPINQEMAGIKWGNGLKKSIDQVFQNN